MIKILTTPEIDILEMEIDFYNILKSLMILLSSEGKNIKAFEGILSIIIGYDLRFYECDTRDSYEIDNHHKITILIEDVLSNLFPEFEKKLSDTRILAIL